MVFGKKPKPPTGHHVPDLPKPVPQPRAKTSYRRSLPPASAIASEVVVPLPGTCACGGSFDQNKITAHERYEEDIPLPELTKSYRAHLVTRYTVRRGVCLACGKATAGRELGGAEVSLGPNVRLLVTHLIASVGLSYAQVSALILSLYNLYVTDGEISAILHKQHQAWQPAYQQLKADIRAAPVVHSDETPWPIQSLQGAGCAWNICDAGSPKVCFALEQSRGVVYARRLFGQDTETPFAGIRITDDYGAYRNDNLPGRQQLCWAHLCRTIRDLRYNANLPKRQSPYVTKWYEAFAGIYQALRAYLTEPYELDKRQTQSDELWQRLQTLIDQPATKAGEPDRLKQLKAQLTRAGQDRLFIYLIADTPCDNNRAERDLRSLVLKRKRSFGSKTEKGAQTLATILSLCTTTWRSSANSPAD